MAFWKKKSEDPWDMDPNRKQQPTPVEKKPPERTIPPWVQIEEPPEPIPCPWCGENMVWGNLFAGSGGSQTSGWLQWREGAHQGFLDSLRFTGRKVDLGAYEEAWYCTACRKLAMDVGLALKRSGPNYVWENGKVKFPKEEPEEENSDLSKTEEK